MRVTFNELTERELNDAAHYYELEQAGFPPSGVDCANASYMDSWTPSRE